MDSIVEVEESKALSSNPRNYYDRAGGPFLKMPFQDILKVTLAPDATEGPYADLLSRPIDWEHVDSLAEKIRAHGFLANQWPTFFFEPGGKLTVSKGNHRTAALQKLAREGFDQIPEVLFYIENKRKTDEDLVAELWLDNDAKDLDQDTKAKVAYTLWKFMNQNVKRVADKLAISTTQVENLLAYNKIPDDIKAMVKNGTSAASNILEAYKQAGENADDTRAILNAALEKAVASGKAKITAKHVKKAKAPTRTKIVQTDVEDFIQNGASEDAQEFVSDLADLAKRAMAVLKAMAETNPDADEVAFELESLLERGERKGFIGRRNHG